MKYLALMSLFLLATAAQARDVSLAWDASTGADAYNVWRAEKVNGQWSAWELIASGQVGTSYVDTTAPNLPACLQWVVTATSSNAESGASNAAEACPPPPAPVPPAPPMQVRVQ